jgi:hypothetical protein
MIWISTKPCVTHAEEMNTYMKKYAYRHTYISASAILPSANPGALCSLEKLAVP